MSEVNNTQSLNLGVGKNKPIFSPVIFNPISGEKIHRRTFYHVTNYNNIEPASSRYPFALDTIYIYIYIYIYIHTYIHT
jgi:hypothetical protein